MQPWVWGHGGGSFFIVVVECTEVQIIETWGETKSGAESARERRARDAKLLDED